jgi:hypothetical protein
MKQREEAPIVERAVHEAARAWIEGLWKVAGGIGLLGLGIGIWSTWPHRDPVHDVDRMEPVIPGVPQAGMTRVHHDAYRNLFFDSLSSDRAVVVCLVGAVIGSLVGIAVAMAIHGPRPTE